MKLEDLSKDLRKKMDKYKISICPNTEFTNEFANYIRNAKHSVTIENCEIIFNGTWNSILLNNATIKDSVIQYSPVDIVNSELCGVKIYNCNFFQCIDSKINDATFIGGTIEILQDHPIIFEFANGTITNSRPDTINFFGYVNTYEFFRNNLDKFPFSKYANELGSIVVMGSRISRDER